MRKIVLIHSSFLSSVRIGGYENLSLFIYFSIYTLFMFQISKSEAQGGVMRLIVGGGRAAESSESRGAVIVGVRTLSEGGRVGKFSREQVTRAISNFPLCLVGICKIMV